MTFITRLLIPFATATAITFSGLSLAADSDKVVATVNGKNITEQDINRYMQNNSQSGALDQESLMNELISRELVYQDAISKGLDKDKSVQAQLNELRTNVILGAALENAMKSDPISDKELKAIYDQQLENYNVQEFKARHILLKEKSDAEKVITELDMGADFSELASKRSTGPSAKQGGDLGWFAAQQMVPEFSQRVATMEKGSYTKEPLQTQFGWHVIKLEDTRSAEPPSFDSVKPKIRKMVEQQRVGNYIKELRDKAEINIK
ncbi:MAG: peptidylprolyl isomerase [Gammaproteobacteria bacterium]|nr:peptidylprolyl isomerase [Gammaproteobacteria bacterium]MCW8839796.1 peptidylprolyl isomerase [Gammaproteobacteria bacterium]MCW8958572.1 peptidylprolyl isomerase [Gammaproteobacteria bacterium]MCW8973926.1 peptidylprolyl isomerase [Gammaproteobacteria bacterium]MCW8993042.1 peptidylprolyl isomerase [Gammaproteobacteria bacterium]